MTESISTLPLLSNKAEKLTLQFYALALFFNFFSISVAQGFLILTCLSFTYVLYQRKASSDKKNFWPITFFLLIVLHLWEVVSSFVNPNTTESLYMLRDFWLYLPVFFLPNLIDNEKDLEKLFRWLAWAAIICGLLGMFQSIAAVNVKQLFKGQWVPLQRKYGIFAEIDGFSGTLRLTGLLFFPLTYFFYRFSTLLSGSYKNFFRQFWQTENLFYVIGFFIILWNIIGTGRRSSLLAIVLVLPLIWLYKTRKVVPLLAAAVVLISFFSFNQGLRSRVSSVVTLSDSSSNERLIMYKTSLFASVEYPIFGIGEANYVALLKEKNAYNRQGEIIAYPSSHNDFLDRLIKGGFPAFILFTLIFVWLFAALWKARLKSAETSHLFSKEIAFEKNDYIEWIEIVFFAFAIFTIALQFEDHIQNDEPLFAFSFVLAAGEVLLKKFCVPLSQALKLLKKESA